MRSTAIATKSGSPISSPSRSPRSPDVGQPSEAELTKFYEAHPDLFRAPEYRGFTLASLSPSDLKPAAEIPEDKLRSEYEQRKDEFETPEQRQIQQILAPTEEKAKEAEAALAAGKDFQEVADHDRAGPGARSISGC